MVNIALFGLITFEEWRFGGGILKELASIKFSMVDEFWRL